jgi:hypothetical protein
MNKVTFDKDTHSYFDASGKKVPCVSDILAHFGISQIDKVRSFIGEQVLKDAADFGTAVHDTTRLHDLNDLAGYDSAIEPWLQSWKNYVWDYKPNFVAIEQSLLSTVWGFAGTPDRVGKAGNGLRVDDLKTGVETVAERIQTAMYAILVEENYGQKVTYRGSIHLRAFDYKIVPHTDKNDIQTAKSLLTIWNFKKSKGLL